MSVPGPSGARIGDNLGRTTQPPMPCPRCGSSAAAPSGRCSVCGTTVHVDAPVDTAVLTPRPDRPPGGDETRMADADETRLTPPPLSSGTRPGLTSTLSVGQNFGPRYHIIRCIGTGDKGCASGRVSKCWSDCSAGDRDHCAGDLQQDFSFPQRCFSRPLKRGRPSASRKRRAHNT